MRTVTAAILAVVIFVAGTLAGTAVSAQRRPSDPQCGSAAAQVRTTLYFGLQKAKGSVSELEWQMFLRDEVTTRFPSGLTAWEAEGQWRGNDGTIGHERRRHGAGRSECECDGARGVVLAGDR